MPAGNEEVLMFNAGALIVSDNVVLADTDALSVSLTVKLEDPGAVGVPEMVPAARLSPAGSAPPVIVQVYGGVPPFPLSDSEYPTPTMPTGKDEVVIVNA